MEEGIQNPTAATTLLRPQPGTEPGPLTIRVSVLPITLLGTSRGHQRVTPEGDPCVARKSLVKLLQPVVGNNLIVNT